MIYKRLSSLLTISLLALSLSACGVKNIHNSIDLNGNIKDSLCYAITTTYANHQSNHYIDIDVRIPKIAYTGTKSELAINSINSEISLTLAQNMEDAIEEARNTYNAYLSRAKENAKEECISKLQSLKLKYKSVIGEKELTIIDDAIRQVNEVNTNTIRKRATDNTLKENKHENKKAIVNGFTSTDNLIIPELHNKNIIVVEASQSSVSENKQPSKSSLDRKIATKSKLNRKDARANENFDAGANTDKDDNENKNEIINNNLDSNRGISSPSIVDGEITLENFNSELNDILSMSIPNDSSLTLAYVPTYLKCDYEVKCLNENFLSLLIKLDTKKTASQTTNFFYNIDLSKKEIIKINDLLGENYKEICINSINNSIEFMSEKEKQNFKKDYDLNDIINRDTPFFINNQGNIIVVLDKFTISNSYQEFQIISK